jgi:transposase
MMTAELLTFDPTEARRQRGLAIAAVCRVTQKNGSWSVPSQSGQGRYTVTLEPKTPEASRCTCKDYENRGEPCKHVYAVQYVIQREQNQDGSETVTESLVLTRQTTKPRKTYKQDWPAYNTAQTTEKKHFQSLLADLCKGIEEPEQINGRPRASLRDMLFSAIFKVYSTVSGRRFQCDLDEAQQKGHIEKTPHYNTVFKYLEMPELSAILSKLVVESSLPLRSVESDFAVDSTGFMSSRFIRWFDHKYGAPKQKHDWVKIHLMCGVKTNVVTAVEIDDRNAADCPKFKPLMETTSKNFQVGEVSADSAYLSYSNMEDVTTRGALPFIAFKSNSTADQGGAFERMFLWYCYKREDYMNHYHKRSNVESTMSMIKAKFGDSLRSKTDTAMRNEALCKVVCHNICCLIQSIHELGITETFGQKESQAVTHDDHSSHPVDAYAWL